MGVIVAIIITVAIETIKQIIMVMIMPIRTPIIMIPSHKPPTPIISN